MKNGGESLAANRLLKAERERRGWSQQDVADKISKLPRGRNDRPNKDVKVQAVTIERV